MLQRGSDRRNSGHARKSGRNRVRLSAVRRPTPAAARGLAANPAAISRPLGHEEIPGSASPGAPGCSWRRSPAMRKAATVQSRHCREPRKTGGLRRRGGGSTPASHHRDGVDALRDRRHASGGHESGGHDRRPRVPRQGAPTPRTSRNSHRSRGTAAGENRPARTSTATSARRLLRISGGIIVAAGVPSRDESAQFPS